MNNTSQEFRNAILDGKLTFLSDPNKRYIKSKIVLKVLKCKKKFVKFEINILTNDGDLPVYENDYPQTLVLKVDETMKLMGIITDLELL